MLGVVDVATWNANSVRTRIDRLANWLEGAQPDVVCLQELKAPESEFPFDRLQKLGYRAAVYGQPTYNGVAIVSRSEPRDVQRGLSDGVADDQARLIAATVGPIRVLSAYVPNGQEVGSEKWAYKLEWLARLRAYLQRTCDPAQPLLLCGDFNIAPDDRDVARPDAWAGSVLCHGEARAALQRLLDWGLVDVVRRFYPEGGLYTWWDYRGRAYERDDGLRLDLILATAILAERVTAARVDRTEREGEKPSDHAPVVVSLDVEDLPEAADRGGRPASHAVLHTTAADRRSDQAVATPAEQEHTRPAQPASTSAAAEGQATSHARPLLMLIDGHSVAYRAFYGLPLYDRSGRLQFSTSGGEITNAVYGFASMLLKSWHEQQPDYVVAAFDRGRTFRDDLFPEYKATRDKMPDELAPQIPRIVELVEAFGVPAVAVEGYEADDILGTLARRAEAEGMEVLIVTGDSDAFQLISDGVRVLAPGRLWSDVAVHDRAKVVARYGLEPAQLIDFKALVGDPSDHVPGVKGVGPKSALPLLQRYGSVQGIYEHLEEVEPERVRRALAADRAMAELSRQLVTIRTDVPLAVQWSDCSVKRYDRGRVEALFDQLEFRGIRSRLPGAPRAEATTGDAERSEAGLEPSRGPTRPAAGASAAPPVDTSGAQPGAARVSEAGLSGVADSGTGAGAAPSGGRGHLGEPPAAYDDGQQMALFPGVHRPAAEAVGRAVAPVTATTIVADEATLERMVAELSRGEIVAFDTEATAPEPLRAELVGVALSSCEGTGYYVPVGHREASPQLPWSVVRPALARLLEDPSRPKAAHNAKYDMAILRQAGIEVRGLAMDTMLAAFVLEPGSRLGLKHLARTQLGIAMLEIEELIGSGKHQRTMADVPIAAAGPYAAADADMTLRLTRVQLPRLEETNLRSLLERVELPLVPVLLDMEFAGVLVDTQHLAVLSERLANRLQEIEAEIYRMVPVPFNVGSPQQLAEVLFKHLKLRAPGARATTTGRVSVAADVLESMRGSHPVIDLVLEHRQLSKIKSTYVDALPQLVHPRSGRVHTSFNQTGAVTGRLSSQDPNLQNIPIRSELGREVREAFVAPEGWRLLAADYSQVELRIAAHLSADPGLKAAFAAGEDIHRATAARVLGVPLDQVTPDERAFAKRVNFGLLYGMGARSLAQQAGIRMTDAQAFVDAYFAAFPNIRRYLEETKRRAKEQGYAETLLGRRRYFPILQVATRDARTNVLQRAAEREAINHPMQGSVADIIKLAMIGIHRALQERHLQARMLLQVHDELVLETPLAEVDEVTDLVRSIMEAAYPLDPPLKVDVGVGRNWLETK